jgi:ribosome-associated toxin RatA of RatAB toxin-antitoxin module
VARVETVNEVLIAAPPERVFTLVAEVEHWPRLLPHYRWVRVLERSDNQKLVRMAARRDWIPVQWTSIQRLYPDQRRITFQHVGGATRGMEVEWTIVPVEGGSRVRIWHQFQPGWPLVPDHLVELVVGRFFVRNIAGKTLRRIKLLAEQTAPEPGADALRPAPRHGSEPAPGDS